MNLSELEAANRATLDWLRQQPDQLGEPMARPFFGFYDVDIFECPSFLMFTANDCPRAWNILAERTFEPQSMRIWCRLAAVATGILDIGAHVGVYSLAAAALRTDLKIHAFEPNPYAFARLRLHKLVNNFKNIREHTFAVGSKNAVVNFSWTKKPNSMIASGGGVGTRTGNSESTLARLGLLDGTGLARLLGEKPLIKVDVEGGEGGTFEGMREILALKPDIILETFIPEACDAINAMILPLGYKVFHILEKEGRLVPRDKLEPCSMQSDDFNQLLTTRDAASIASLT